MSDDRRAVWDERHAQAADPGRVPVVLTQFAALLPSAGQALDLACGRGAGALWLARRGLAVSAWDYSSVAIDRLRQAARSQGLAIDAQQRDVCSTPLPPDSFDLILVSQFLERRLFDAIAAALKPGGVLCYQTFGPASSGSQGPRNPEFRLASNELLRSFPALTVRAYLEPGDGGATDDPSRGLALLVAMRGQA